MLRTTGVDPDMVGERVVHAIIGNEAYIFTHMDVREWLEARHREIETAFDATQRSEEHTSELQSLMRISYAVFCLKKKKNTKQQETQTQTSNNSHKKTTTQQTISIITRQT